VVFIIYDSGREKNSKQNKVGQLTIKIIKIKELKILNI
jgi:hypothetical protein